MLKIRIIPTLLWKNFGLVKGTQFNSWRRVGSVLPAIKVYNTRDVDELILVDITASPEGHEPDYDGISDVSDHCFVPLTAGGGITCIDHITRLLRAGADKVCLNSVIYQNSALVEQAALRFGAQCVVASVDVRETRPGHYECFSHAGTRPTGREPIAWARELAARGAGEILLTSIDRDGTMQGYDLGLTAAVAAAVSVPVIASGGAGSYEDLRCAVTQAGASAVAAASIYHFTEQTPAGAKAHLRAAGIAVRSAYLPV